MAAGCYWTKFCIVSVCVRAPAPRQSIMGPRGAIDYKNKTIGIGTAVYIIIELNTSNDDVRIHPHRKEATLSAANSVNVQEE